MVAVLVDSRHAHAEPLLHLGLILPQIPDAV
jgi:hypothetical protein